MLCLDIHWPDYFFAPVVIFCFLQLNFVICLFWMFFFFSLAVGGCFRHGGCFFSQLTRVLANVQTTFTVPKSSITEVNQQPVFQSQNREGLVWNVVLSLSLCSGEVGDQGKSHQPIWIYCSKNMLCQMNILSCWGQRYDIFLFFLYFRLLIWLPIAILFCLANCSESVFKA